MRFLRQSRVQRAVASLVLAALSVAWWPAAAAQGAARDARAAELDRLLAHPAAVRAALAAADAMASPEAAVGAFVEAYRDATGNAVPAGAVAAAVADLFLGRSLRPVPLPETKLVAAGPSPASAPATGTAWLAPTRAGAADAAGTGVPTAEASTRPGVPPRRTPPARAP